MKIKIFFGIHLISYCVLYSYYIGKAETGKVELSDLGYNGTWEQFCNRSNIAADFSNFTDHDMMRLRMSMCQLDANNNLDRESLPIFAAYKYCSMMNATVEGFYNTLKKKFAEHLVQRVGEMPTTARPSDECYTKTMEVFNRECIGKANPCYRMFQSLLSVNCVKPGISTEDISRYIVEVCDGKFITDEVDWKPIMMSIRYTD